MRRSNGTREDYRGERESENRPQRGSGFRPSPAHVDDQVLALRETGRSYASVARTLGIKRATDAHSAFVRAVRARPEGERAELNRREAERLDILETRIRTRDANQPARMERRLQALEVLRSTLK
jgi:hypothetical protein